MLVLSLDENNVDYQDWQTWDRIDGNTTEDVLTMTINRDVVTLLVSTKINRIHAYRT